MNEVEMKGKSQPSQALLGREALEGCEVSVHFVLGVGGVGFGN